jgi:hypothetical protein
MRYVLQVVRKESSSLFASDGRKRELASALVAERPRSKISTSLADVFVGRDYPHVPYYIIVSWF